MIGIIPSKLCWPLLSRFAITDVSSFLGLKPYKTIENGSSSSKESHQQASKADQTRQTAQASGPIQVQELYKPVGSTIAFFEAINRGKDELFAPAEARQAAIDYIKEKNLANPRNQK